MNCIIKGKILASPSGLNLTRLGLNNTTRLYLHHCKAKGWNKRPAESRWNYKETIKCKHTLNKPNQKPLEYFFPPNSRLHCPREPLDPLPLFLLVSRKGGSATLAISF